MSKVLGPDGLPIYKDGNPASSIQNDDRLVAAEIMGRCSVCSATGCLVFENDLVPPGIIDRVLAYRSVKCFCERCKKETEFLPIEVKKYTDKDLELLKNLQKNLQGVFSGDETDSTNRDIMKPVPKAIDDIISRHHCDDCGKTHEEPL